MGLSSALNGLTTSNFTLLNSSGYSIPTTANHFKWRTDIYITAPLSVGQIYTVSQIMQDIPSEGLRASLYRIERVVN